MIRIKESTVFLKHGYLEAEIFTIGATVNQIFFRNNPILDAYSSPSELGTGGYKSAWLFPFPNRIKKGEYLHHNKKYSFPINDPSGATNAIHGFLCDRKFSITQSSDGKDQVSVELSHDYRGELPYFPFPFTFSVSYLLSVDYLTVKIKIFNSGSENLPFGVGWHPYFLTSDLSKSKLVFPLSKRIKTDHQMIPAGETEPFETYSKGKDIEKKEFDDCFQVREYDYWVSLQSEQCRVSFEMNKDWPYFQLYTPPLRSSIALEPMSCNINAFNNKQGLRVLEGGKSDSLHFSVRFSEV